MADLIEDNKELASQLRCPSGENGKLVGEQMELTNQSMIKETLSHLSYDNESTVLEIGPGNGFHLASLINRYKKTVVVDISKDMLNTIEHKFKNEIAQNRLVPVLSDGKKISVNASVIDEVFSVNTLYFWEQPLRFLKEISHCLKPNGTLLLAFSQKESIEHLPFIKYGFTLYNEQDFRELCDKSPFEINELVVKNEKVKAKNGDELERSYIVASLVKKPSKL